ncbi:MAG: SEC-C metal-binding domain-containing protein [archaeon]
MQEISLIIKELKQYDNEERYDLEYDTVKEKLNPVIKKLIEMGDPALDLLHELIRHEETWSCLFALEILKEIISEKSIPFLIDFIISNDDLDYFESGEEAMYALHNIGVPAIEPLIAAVIDSFAQKKYIYYLVGALNEIKDQRVYSFMKEIVNDYLAHNEKYVGWFVIDDFVHDFDKQGKEEILPLLRQILEIKSLSERQQIEIKDTIEVIENPEEYDKKIKEISRSIDDKMEKRKLGRNEPCWCGSEKKYKKCCLDKDIKEKGKPRKVFIVDEKEYIGNLDEFETD